MSVYVQNVIEEDSTYWLDIYTFEITKSEPNMKKEINIY